MLAVITRPSGGERHPPLSQPSDEHSGNISEGGITMEKYTKAEAVKVLEVSKAKMAEAKTRDEALEILREAGKEVGYTPAFRCLVIGKTPEESIKWK